MSKVKILIISILVVAIILRFYELGNNPPSLDWDEASLGYNAYSILQTGKDEYGISLPINLKSFGDYKPAAYVYLAIPSIAFLGLDEMSVRLPSAILGLLTVISFYGIVSILFAGSPDKNKIALLSAFLLAFSPWHVQFSRVAFEANIGVSFFVLGLWALLYSQKNPIYIPIGLLAWVLSLYSYHSMRLFVPLFFIGAFWYFKKPFFLYRRWFTIGILLGLVAIVPLLYSYMDPQSSSRFQAVNIFSTINVEEVKRKELDMKNHDYLGSFIHTQKINQLRTMASHYMDQFDPNFLFLKGDEYGRHNAVDMGLFYFIELPFLLIGILYLYNKHKKMAYFCLIWLILAPIPASITQGTPHAVRFMTVLPLPYIFIAVGIVEWMNKKKSIRNYFALVFVFIFSINIAYYLSLYFIHTPVEASQDWQFGYKQAVNYMKINEERYSKIVVTNKYDQPYIYLLFYKPVEPRVYQKIITNPSQSFRAFGKYEFRKIDWNNDQHLSNTLFLVAPEDVLSMRETEINKLEQIQFLDGTTAFYIIKR